MTVSELRRIRVGSFRIDGAVTLDRLEESSREGKAVSLLVPIVDALGGLPRWEVPELAVPSVRNGRLSGQWLVRHIAAATGDLALLVTPDPEPLAIVHRDRNGLWKIARGICLSRMGWYKLIPQSKRSSLDATKGERQKVMSLVTEKKSDIIGKFRVHETDTGSPEVQVALLTERINMITDHLKVHSKDFSTRRGLLKLVGQRRRLLDYLKSVESMRYKALLETLGLRK
jgi:small subunit ribosomal protein S15